ncbi:MAG: riboflavin synthase [Myxococcota bacterium]|nr:riboflavin synthase [Myxococcota bacterium]MDW8361834.1 riboflavin synthase [Myxococcales bacterium]
MFTGIVEEMGRVSQVEDRPGSRRLVVAAERVVRDTRVGDSVSVHGVCLTVVALDEAAGTLAFDAVPETLRRTTLGALRPGDAVNLERAARLGTPIGGHLVQGHVDGTARVSSIEPDGDALRVIFEIDPDLGRWLVPRGFVAVDGASLTVVRAEPSCFEVTLVPHTRRSVVLGSAAVGYLANVEIDVTARHVERAVGERLAALERRLGELADAFERRLGALESRVGATRPT